MPQFQLLFVSKGWLACRFMQCSDDVVMRFVARKLFVLRIIPSVLVGLQPEQSEEAFLADASKFVELTKEPCHVFGAGDKISCHIHVSPQFSVDILFTLQNGYVAHKLPKTELLEERVRLRDALDWLLHYLAGIPVDIMVVFKGTVGYLTLLALKRTLIEDDVINKEACEGLVRQRSHMSLIVVVKFGNAFCHGILRSEFRDVFHLLPENGYEFLAVEITLYDSDEFPADLNGRVGKNGFVYIRANCKSRFGDCIL